MHEPKRERLVETFLDLVRISSPSWRERGVIEYIASALNDLNVSYSLHPCGESHNLLARLEGEDSRAPILLSCHTDTVVPCDRVVPVVTRHRISSDGATVLGGDDKAAIASFIEALRVIREHEIPHGPVELLFSCAEEIGLYGARGFDLSLLRARYGFVFDSGGDIGSIILHAPTQISMELFVRGKAAHAGMEPEKGISAIRVLAEIISAIPHGRIDERTTVNAGIISGGKATNIVADEAYCKLEARSLDRSSLSRVEEKIRKASRSIARRHGARLRIARRLEYSGFSLKGNDAVVRIARSAIQGIGKTPVLESSGGGSDTNIFNRAGIPSVNLSVGMRRVHTTKEFIYTRDLVDAARLVLAIVENAR